MIDSIRKAFADCSTSNEYYASKADAYYAFNAVLLDYGCCLDDMDWPGCNDSRTVVIWNDHHDVVGHAYLSWFQMPSGHWEVIGYIT